MASATRNSGANGCLWAVVVVFALGALTVCNYAMRGSGRPPAPEWFSCLDHTTNRIPAFENLVKSRLAPGAPYTHQSLRVTEGAGQVYLEVLEIFSTVGADGKPAEGMALGRIYDRSCAVREFQFICPEPGTLMYRPGQAGCSAPADNGVNR